MLFDPRTTSATGATPQPANKHRKRLCVCVKERPVREVVERAESDVEAAELNRGITAQLIYIPARTHTHTHQVHWHSKQPITWQMTNLTAGLNLNISYSDPNGTTPWLLCGFPYLRMILKQHGLFFVFATFNSLYSFWVCMDTSVTTS